MNQSSVIFGGLFVGFVIYITIRGRLPAYVALFYQKGAASSAAVNAPLTVNPTGTGLNPITPQGLQVPYIGLTPSSADPFSGFLPAA